MSVFVDKRIVGIERFEGSFVPESVHLEELGHWSRQLFLGFAEDRSQGGLWEVTFEDGAVDVLRGDEIEVAL